jgi:hypothetical protein
MVDLMTCKVGLVHGGEVYKQKVWCIPREGYTMKVLNNKAS